MPQLDFDPKHKSDQTGSFPRLKLEFEERARVYVGLESPTYAYVHTLKAPLIEEGKPVYEEVQGRTQLANKFLSRPLCFGDLGIIAESGADPKNCIMCKQAVESDRVDAPQRRWVVQVVKYQTKPGSFEMAKPPSVALQVWGFPDSVYNQLADIASEWASGGVSGLRTHDLRLGPCENKNWQKFKIEPAANSAVMEDPKVKELVLETYKENKINKDLETFCGRRMGASFVQADLNKIEAAWRVVNGENSKSQSATSLQAELGDLMNEVSRTPVSETPASEPKADLGERFNDSSSTTKKSGTIEDFESLLGNL